MIRLFTTSFPESDPVRRSEYAEALARNYACEALGEICILDEVPPRQQSESRIVRRYLPARPRYQDYFNWINEVAAADDISIIANADIAFDDRVRVLDSGVLAEGTVMALARWDQLADGSFTPRNRNDSQDSWVFRGKVRAMDGDFPVGVPRCDNHLAYILREAGYSVRNPAFSVPSYHFHAASRDDYPGGEHPGFVPGPYAYVWPHNLLAAHRTILHNFRNPHARAGWRFDVRFVKWRLRLHRVAKLWSIATGNRQPSKP